ncbi:gp436 family protein [Chromobacterium subtsugae]|uniref:gp436 family protein n=1 Tax=Chromobacterium subtsugae TaxID=251747 RepID=UPI000640BC6A|nr:phage protein Gp36 family protein [Chromobacterium subtsugae]
MAYAAQADMVARFGDLEIIQLTDRARTGQIDAGVLQGALDDASCEIDSYLADRYLLPMPQVPRILVGLCCDIARYRLSGAETIETNVVRDRYRDAVAYLQRVALGKVTLGVTPAGNPVQTGATIEFNGGSRIFSSRDRGAF